MRPARNLEGCRSLKVYKVVNMVFNKRQYNYLFINDSRLYPAHALRWPLGLQADLQEIFGHKFLADQ